MNYIEQKSILKKLRTELEDENNNLHVEFASELIEQINTLIGRINCYSTSDDTELETLAIEDGIRE